MGSPIVSLHRAGNGRHESYGRSVGATARRARVFAEVHEDVARSYHVESEPLTRPAGLLAGQACMGLEVCEFCGRGLLDDEDALCPISGGVAVGNNIRH